MNNIDKNKNLHFLAIILMTVVLLLNQVNLIANVKNSEVSNQSENRTELANSKNTKHCIFPDVFTLQTGGYLGFIVFGMGYSFFENIWEISIFYGYVPEIIGGHDIHTLALKTNIYPITFSFENHIEICPLYVGFMYLYALDPQLHWDISTDCPDEYYMPSGMNLALNLGFQILQKEPKKGSKIGFFAELSFLDVYFVAYYFEDDKQLELKDCLTVALGLRLFL